MPRRERVEGGERKSAKCDVLEPLRVQPFEAPSAASEGDTLEVDTRAEAA